jgi:hypothetical protein
MNLQKKADFDIWEDGDNNDFSCYYYWRRYEPLFDCLVKISEWGCTYIFYYYLKNSMLTSANIQWLHEYCNKIMVIMSCSFDLWYLSPVHIRLLFWLVMIFISLKIHMFSWLVIIFISRSDRFFSYLWCLSVVKIHSFSWLVTMSTSRSDSPDYFSRTDF